MALLDARAPELRQREARLRGYLNPEKRAPADVHHTSGWFVSTSFNPTVDTLSTEHEHSRNSIDLVFDARRTNMQADTIDYLKITVKLHW